MQRLYVLLVSFLLLFFSSQAQYATNGTATPLGPNEFRITEAVPNSAGSVWNTTQLNLNQNFEINTQMYFGAVDANADGMAFLLQAEGTGALGNTGAGIGYHRDPRIAPSVVIEFDTYYNDFTGDIVEDHIAFMRDGSAFHTGPNATILTSPAPLPNIETGTYLDVRFSWNATTKTLSATILGITYSYTGDIVNNIFGGNPMVYWGFTGSTGNGPNEHKVKIIVPQTAITVTGTTTNTTCNTGGSVDITVSGGTPPYTYSWSNGSTSQDLTNVPAGSYTVTVTDAAGATKQATFTVGNGCTPGPITITGTVTNTTCNTGGSVDITVSGGTPPYTYSWSSGSTSQDLTNVPAGSYTVTVTDAAGATKQATFTVGNGCTPSPITITGTVTNTTCNSGGKVDITVSGGTPPYTYSWSNGSTSQDITNVPAGSYTVTVTDAAGATKQATFTVGNGCTPGPITITGTVTNTTCNTGGSVDITVSGGTPPYTYAWSNGSTSQDITNVPAGSYTVTVTDAAGATKQATFTVGNGCNTSPITITGVVTNASCNSGGSVDITVTGGTPPYTYSWSNGSTSQDLTNVPAGSYTVTVTDAAGATKQKTFVVGNSDNTPPQVSCSNTVTQCYNSYNYYFIPPLTASDNCGVTSVTYTITGATNRSGIGKNASGIFNPGTSTIVWKVKDAAGNQSTCTTQVVIKKVNVVIPDVYAVNPGGNANTIYLGYGPGSLTLTANVSGGTAPYTYKWSTNAVTQSITVSPNRPGTYTYTVTVKDASGCTGTATKTVKVVDVRCGNNKIVICHIPNGNPRNAHEICVSKNAGPAHFAHGDKLGRCRNNNDDDDDDDDDDEDEDDDDDDRVGYVTPEDVTIQKSNTIASSLVHPNPSRGRFDIQLTGEQTGATEVVIINANGLVVEKRTVQANGKGQVVRFDLSKQAAGIYLVKLISDKGVQTQKIIIQR